MIPTDLPTIEDVRAAARRIAPHVHRTPVATSATFDRELGAHVFFKCENQQKVGAFKVRGATNAVLRLDDDTARAGVITHSSGNHGAALAYAAARRGIPCTVVIPHDAAAVKLRAIEGYGAELALCERAERDALCARLARERGMHVVHPFEDPDVIAGQGTAALELLEQVGELDLVVAPVGGGGLLSGTTLAVRGASPRSAVWGAEPRAVDDAFRSLESGKRQPGESSPRSWCDGLLTGLGERAFEILRANDVRIVTVGEQEILEAAWAFVQRMKLVVEPSGAITLAALRERRDELAGRRIGVILSGGNTDFSWLGEIGRS